MKIESHYLGEGNRVGVSLLSVYKIFELCKCFTNAKKLNQKLYY